MKKQTNNQGFTLVEMLVAVSLFTVVAFIVTTTFITMIDAYRRSQNIRLVVENLNFSMDGITIRLREGSEFKCLTANGTTATDCSDPEGYPGIIFRPSDAVGEDRMAYLFGNDGGPNGGLGHLKQCVGSCDSDNSNYTILTSPFVNITDVRFIVKNTDMQPRVTIFLKGEAGPEKNRTDLAIQTTVSQRNIDNTGL
jgi:prepilin-type N-terminal cleavage/methylation domain-containing protein